MTNPPDYVSNDGSISFGYARNWANGFGPGYDPGERVERYRDLPWKASLAAGSHLDLDLVNVASYWGLFILATLILMPYLGRQLTGLPVLWPTYLLFPLLLACNRGSPGRLWLGQ